MKAVASRSAWAGSTSNSSQIRATMAPNGVLPSAASQISVPTAFRVFRVLSSARRITASPSYTRQAVWGLRATQGSGTLDDLPEAGVEAEGEVEARDRLHEVGRNAQHSRRQLRLPGEEQDVREEPLKGLPGLDGVEGMSAAMVEEVDPAERGGTILPHSRELARERRPVTAGTLVKDPHDGKLVAQQGGVGGEAGDSCLPASRRTAKQMRPPPPDQARGVHHEPTDLEKRQGVDDPKEGIDRDLVANAERHRPGAMAEVESPGEVPALDGELRPVAVAPDDDLPGK